MTAHDPTAHSCPACDDMIEHMLTQLLAERYAAPPLKAPERTFEPDTAENQQKRRDQLRGAHEHPQP